jgi:hypothetical protein
LQGIQPEIGEFGDLFSRSPDPEDAASVLGALLTGKEIVVESSVTTWHALESRAGAGQGRTGDIGQTAMTRVEALLDCLGSP